ncbi:MAG: hypothetical protein JNJ75_08480 [Cyclobacteriaceae bacterium]|nr:hypothetical protein [Cyclobacteriaceae bacterium]
MSTDLKELLDQFLNRWTVSNVQKMKLDQYVGVKDKDTFCQWIETRTRLLGSIKGMTSIKFGIYKRKNPSKKPKKFFNDSEYSWSSNHGTNRKAAFKKIHNEILEVIRFSERGEFDKIDEIDLLSLFKWKVAFLYSNERLIPIYKHDVLIRIAQHFGLAATKKTPISQIQNLMISNKPAKLDVYEFMRKLYDQFGQKNSKKSAYSGNFRKAKRIKRKATASRNTKPQVRTVTRSYVAVQRHNKLQEALRKLLIAEHGKDSVVVEENYVDLKLVKPNHIVFYEVKSCAFASDCVKEALGQILQYSLNDTDVRPKKHVIVGQYPATEEDEKYIKYVQKNLRVNFGYMNVDLD